MNSTPGTVPLENVAARDTLESILETIGVNQKLRAILSAIEFLRKRTETMQGAHLVAQQETAERLSALVKTIDVLRERIADLEIASRNNNQQTDNQEEPSSCQD
jgi:TolA-binding protein